MRKHYLATLFLFHLHASLYPQVYPVRVRVFLSQPPPSSLYLFTEPGKLRVEIYPADLTLNHYPVLLRMTLSGDRLSLTSDLSAFPNPLYLNGGEMLTLRDDELAPWFRPDHLQVSGMSRQALLQNPLLPEGFYTLSLEVLDFYRKIPISSCTPALFMVSFNDPPLPNQPADAEEIPWNEPQEIFFTWTPRHNPLAYPGFMPQYTLALWEVLQQGQHPEDVVRRQPPLATISCSSPFYHYSLSDPLLTPGKTYVWRVRAEDPLQRTAFSNDGWSQAFTFRYSLPCRAPDIHVQAVGQNTVHLAWDPQPEHLRYLVQFRPWSTSRSEEQPPVDWYTMEASSGKAMVDRLRGNTDYQFRLAAFCRSREPAFSAPVVARTARREFRCGEELHPVIIDNFNPLPMLRKGDIITAAGFEVTVLDVTGSNGYFSGRGVVTVPWMSYIKLEVAFEDIYVNELYQLADGQIQAVYRMGNALVTGLPSVNRPNRIRNAYPQVCDRNITLDSAVASVTLGLDGQIVIVSSDGKQKVVDPGAAKTIAITSPAGKQYLVERTDKGTSIFEAPPIVNQDRTKPTADERSRNKGRVLFRPHPQQKYGIDLPAAEDPPGNYKTRTLAGENILVGWKAVAEGQTDKITALEQDITDSLYFSMASGNVVMSRRQEQNQREILLAGNPHEQEDALYGWVTEENPTDSAKRRRTLAGEITVVSYPLKYQEVILVPVNRTRGIDPNRAAEYLNSIYSQAAVQFRVLAVDSFSVSLNDKSGRLDNTDRNNRMDYSDEMKLVIRSWKKNVLYDPQACYMFLLGGSVDPTEAGYMPLGRRFGFLFRNNQSEEELLHTLAHELGHGLFTLRHTFSTSNRFYQPTSVTTNLMSYGPPSSTRLYKYQWDQIQNPSLALFS